MGRILLAFKAILHTQILKKKQKKKKMVNSYSTPKMIIDKAVPLHDLMMIIGLQ